MLCLHYKHTRIGFAYQIQLNKKLIGALQVEMMSSLVTRLKFFHRVLDIGPGF